MTTCYGLIRRQVCAAAALLLLPAILAGCATAPESQPELSRWGESSTELPSAPAAVETPATAPAIHSGDVWIDRIGDKDKRFVVGATEKSGAAFVDEWGNQMRTTAEWNVLTYRSLTFADAPPTNYDPAMQWFSFPLEPGKEWNMTSRWQAPDLSLVGTTVVEGRVGNWEDIEVPAGKFHALRVDISNRVYGRMGAAQEIDITYWWVPAVNRWVKYYYRGTTEGTILAEMVAYQPAAGAHQ